MAGHFLTQAWVNAFVEQSKHVLGLLLDQQELEAGEASSDLGHHVWQEVWPERGEEAQADRCTRGICGVAGDAPDLIGLAQHDPGPFHDGFARTEVEEVFQNDTPRVLEGRYLFPVPPDASVSRLALWVGEQLVEGEIVERQLAYWKQQLGPNLPTLQLPLDHTPPQQPTFRGARQILSVPLELTQKLRRLAHREGATLFIALLTALKALFFRYIEQSDIVVGIVTAGRQRPELAPLCGFFPNTLVLRTQMAGGLTFRQLLRRVREVALQAFDNQDVPFERIVEALNPERRPGETPLFRVGFILDPPTPPLGVEWEMTSLDVELDAAKFDISLELVEVPHGLVGRISYRTELFEPLRMQRMARHYVTLLESATESPDQPVALMPLLCTDERARLLAAACATAPFPDLATVHALFEAQVDAAPESPALRYLDAETSYRELDAAANRVAHALRRRGLGPGSLVALCAERSPLLCAGLLGILKAGAAFVPLDPAYPRDRLALMLRDSAAPLLLSESRLLERLPEPRPETICLDDVSWQQAEPAERPPRAATPSDLCYVIYTSGSTGRPKGVLIEHRGVCNLAAAQAQTFALDAYSRVLQFASPSFDASVFEICMALLHGCTLVLAPREQTLPGPELIELLIGQRIDTLTITPSVLAALPHVELPELRTLIVAGEACPAELVARWAPGRVMWNAYGPTEATVWATVARCEPSELQPPIGRPIQNAAVYILDPNLQLVPEDVAGEICIGGVGVARGYLGRPELTAERFVRDPFSADPQARLYRSGDLGRWRADGQLEFLGRLDDQVKVRGVRIEAANVLADLPDSAIPEYRRAERQAALQDYEAALALDADWPAVNVNLGNLRLRQGRPAEAVAAYQRAIRIDPRYVGGYVNLADAWRQQGKDAEAEQVLRQGLATLPQAADLHHALGLLLVRQNKRDAALLELAEGARLAPENAHYAYVYAIALDSAGRRREALVTLRGALQRHPDDLEILGALVSISRDAGDRQAALRYAKQAAALLPGNAELAQLVAALEAR